MASSELAEVNQQKAVAAIKGIRLPLGSAPHDHSSAIGTRMNSEGVNHSSQPLMK